METLDRLSAADLRSVVVAYVDALRAHRESINRLNVYPVPDADTGTNMALTVGSVAAELDDAGDMASTCAAIARGALVGGRGISGLILSQVFRTLAESFAELDRIDAGSLARGLAAASEAAQEAVLDPVEGTILTVLRKTADAASAAVARDGSLAHVLEAARTAARAAVAKTPDLLPALKAAGVVDAGGTGFALFLDAVLHVVCGSPLPEPEPVAARSALPVEHGRGEGGGLRYEVACLLDAPDEVAAEFRRAWALVGAAAVVVGGEGTWSCHIHTDEPNRALEIASRFGRLRDARVIDLGLQVEGAWGPRDETEEGLPDEPVRTAVIAVGDGDGVRRLLRSLGAQRIVGQGRATSPSVGELLEAVASAPAAEVLVLPDDRNVVPAAEQLAGLTAKRVRVVPSRSLAEGLAALRVYDPQASADDNADRMAAAASAVGSGELVQAVRDAGTELGPVREGDWLGLTPDGIRAVASGVVEAATALLEHLLVGGVEVVTIIEGQGSSEEATRGIIEWLGERRPDLGVQVLRGGQPTRPYVFGVE